MAAAMTCVPSHANAEGITTDRIAYSTRAHWMRKANEALFLLSGPCPFGAFGTAIVNHTACPWGGLGELVCIGVNILFETGNPTLHGEQLSLFTDTCADRQMQGRWPLSRIARLSSPIRLVNTG